MKFNNLRNIDLYKVIINEEEAIYIKNIQTGEIILFNREIVFSFEEARKKFGDVPSINNEGKYYVLDLKIKSMELVLDCAVKKISEVSDPVKAQKILELMDTKSFKDFDQENDKIIIMSIWHRNLTEPVLLKIKKFKNGQDIMDSLEMLREFRDKIKEPVRATRYRPQAIEGVNKGMKGRGKLMKSWAA